MHEIIRELIEIKVKSDIANNKLCININDSIMINDTVDTILLDTEIVSELKTVITEAFNNA